MNEKEIIKRCQNGDSAAFEELIRSFYPYVTKYLLKLTHDEVLTEDLTQDVFLKAIRAIEDYKPEGKASFATYIITISAIFADNYKEIYDEYDETIKYFYTQGIDVKIISGDNAYAASAVAAKAGIRNTDLYIDMSEVSDDAIGSIADKYVVYGRVTPKQKKLLIAAMQKNGHKVAMAGDGVNDLLAMRQADCSAAMGAGCDAAKQTAQLVLLDSDFSVLKDVISEGRRVINNLTKSAGVFFIKTIYSVLLCILCLLFNVKFPFLPIQITLIDAVIEAFPAFFMSFEKNDIKCESSFLQTAVRSALPNGIAVFVCCAVLLAISGYAGIDNAQISLLMYLSVGFISLVGVIKASMPFNLLRGFLAISSALGFFGGVILFSNILQLPPFPFM